MSFILRWLIAILGWAILFLIYAAWKDAQPGGFIVGFFRGAIIFGAAYYLLIWARGPMSSESNNSNRSAEIDSEDLNLRREGSIDPELMSAVRNGNWSTASRLLNDGVKPFGRDSDGSTLLDIANKNRDSQMIRLLRAHRAP